VLAVAGLTAASDVHCLAGLPDAGNAESVNGHRTEGAAACLAVLAGCFHTVMLDIGRLRCGALFQQMHHML
jgi:hypothetical protein